MAMMQEQGVLAKLTAAKSGRRAHSVVTTLLVTLYAVIYLDRVNISAAASSIKLYFGLTNTELGLTFSAFSWAYLASVFFGGWAARKYGARVTLIVCAVIVGLGTVLTGVAGGLATLLLARMAVGLGEGPAFPAARQAMRNWYPPHRFGFIQGITHSASRFGAAVAAPIVAGLILLANWRVSFIACGVAALVWAGIWSVTFRDDPHTHPGVAAKDLEGLSVAVPNRNATTPFWALTKRMFPITLVTFAYGWTYWVFVSWMPLYFMEAHGTNLKNSAFLTSALFVAGLIGNTVGGVVSDTILKRTRRTRLARCSVVAVSLLGAAAFIAPTIVLSDLRIVVPLLAAAMFFLEMTIAPMYAITMDVSKEFAGMASAYVIMGVAVAGIISPPVFGWLIDVTHNWNIPFATGVGILVCGAAATALLRPDIPFVAPEAE